MVFAAQFVGSLAAILVLAWIARSLGLGRDVCIRDEEHAQILADEVVCGFDAQETAVDQFGKAALLRDPSGQIILVKVHGAQFSGRLLGRDASAAIRNDNGKALLEVNSGEWLFGKAFLKITRAERWVNAINSATGPAHA